ncbi:MAG: hypothetical protein CMG74_06250 [Candidatus Marinimicrobia bacterium]|nr:hypothetical protein [Candidatus Neomarinimicrobiota bacterium]
MRKILFFCFFFGYANGQMKTGNDLYTALTSVNETEKNYGKYFIAGFVTGHWSALDGLNPYNKFDERYPNDIRYNKFLESSIIKIELYPKNQIVGWEQVFLIIERYLKHHPNERNEKIELLIAKSMLDAYPMEYRLGLD